jgi:Gram-negative bacterial TonB protein C-terminal
MFRLSLAFALAVCASGQEPENPWRSLTAENPQGATLTLRIAEPHLFHVGELIPIDVDLRDPKMGTDRVYSFGGVLLDPASPCGTPPGPCRLQNRQAAIPATMNNLGQSNGTLHGELNLYVPALDPGKYRVAVLADCMERVSGTAQRGMFRAGSVKAVSNVEEFEIIPATPEWVNATVAAAASLLESPASKGDEARRTYAARQLRYLQTPQSWQASLDLLAKAPAELMAGLNEADNQKAVCQLLLSRLTAPKQFVNSDYLYSLDTICGEPDLPAARPGDLVIRTGHVSRVEQAAADLAAHLHEKEEPAKTAARNALLAYADSREPKPSWLPLLRRELPGPRQPENPSLRISSPRDHTMVHPGETVNVVVDAHGIFSDIVMVGQEPLPWFSQPAKPPATFAIQIPKQDIQGGQYMLSAFGVLTSGEHVESEPIYVDVEPVWGMSDDASQLPQDAPGVTIDTGGIPLTHRPAVRYPAEALARGVEGTLVLDITPDWQGRTSGIEWISGPNALRGIDFSTWHFPSDAGAEPRRVKIVFNLAEARRHAAAGTSFGSPFGVPNTSLFFWRLPNPLNGCCNGPAKETRRRLRTLDIMGVSQHMRDKLMKSAPVQEGDEIGTEQMGQMVNWSSNLDSDLRVWMLQAGDEYAVTILPTGFLLGVREQASKQELANQCVLPAAAHTSAPRIRAPGAVPVPKLISRVEPVSARGGQAKTVRGSVRLHVIIDKQGGVLYASAVSGNPALYRSAEEAVKHWKYSPTVVNGRAAQVITEVELPAK